VSPAARITSDNLVGGRASMGAAWHAIRR
jgi:hypothetical protein